MAGERQQHDARQLVVAREDGGEGREGYGDKTSRQHVPTLLLTVMFEELPSVVSSKAT